MATFLSASFSLLQVFPFCLSQVTDSSPEPSGGSDRGRGFCGPLYLSTRPAAGSRRERSQGEHWHRKMAGASRALPSGRKDRLAHAAAHVRV